MQITVQERFISLAGCGNFRDLGGYENRAGRRVRWRRLFRSDALVWLTPEDIALMHEMGLKLVAGLDLRTHDELQTVLPMVLFENGTRHHHLPFFPTFGEDRERMREVAHAVGQVGGERYLELLEQARPCFNGLMTFLADEANFPSAFYCAAGKDRTGMVSALLLRLLGVSDEQIIEDYALTTAPTEERLVSRLKALGRDPSERADPASMMAYPETMEHFLAGFDRLHGSIEDFLLACDLQESTLDRARQNLLED